MKISVSNRQTAVRLDVKHVRALVRRVIARESFTYEEITIHFVGPRKISHLHQQFFHDPSVTDCITFPLATSDERCIAGDVFVCPQQAIDYVQAHGGDVMTEILRYVIHGLLHLMGYDDTTPHARRAMRAAEKKHIPPYCP